MVRFSWTRCERKTRARAARKASRSPMRRSARARAPNRRTVRTRRRSRVTQAAETTQHAIASDLRAALGEQGLSTAAINETVLHERDLNAYQRAYVRPNDPLTMPSRSHSDAHMLYARYLASPAPARQHRRLRHAAVQARPRQAARALSRRVGQVPRARRAQATGVALESARVHDAHRLSRQTLNSRRKMNQLTHCGNLFGSLSWMELQN